MKVLKNYPLYVTSNYGPRSSGFHRGIDLVGLHPHNYTVLDYICAKEKGVVTNVRKDCTGFEGNNSYGNFVHIDHLNGYSTVYAHLAHGSINVNIGDRVEEGQIIGYMGNTGHSFGGHLHFEVRVNNQQIDPTEYALNDKPILPKVVISEPVAEDKEVNQVLVTCDNTMRCRTTPEIKDDNCLGFYKTGFYNVLEEKTTDYHWCKVAEDNWVACIDGYANYISMKKEEEIPEISAKEENSTITSEDIEIKENEEEKQKIEEKKNPLIEFIKILLKVIRFFKNRDEKEKDK